jgi:AcrR family transcriptional regulator
VLGEPNVDRVTRRRTAVRDDILAAAWDLAERDGVAAFSLRDLAAQVGMRAPSLYGYFPGKPAIYDAMFAQGYAALDAAMAEVPVDAGDPAGTLAAGTRRFLAFCQASPARYQLLFSRAVPGWEPSPEAYAGSQASMAATRELLAALGVVADDAVDLWLSVSAGLAAQQLANDPTGDRWVRLVDEAAQMFMQHHEQTRRRKGGT